MKPRELYHRFRSVRFLANLALICVAVAATIGLALSPPLAQLIVSVIGLVFAAWLMSK